MDAEEWAREMLEAFGKKQEEGRALGLPCPRCGEYSMDSVLCYNALSRYADVYICSRCGEEEAVREMMGDPLPLNLWHRVRILS